MGKMSFSFWRILLYFLLFQWLFGGNSSSNNTGAQGGGNDTWNQNYCNDDAYDCSSSWDSDDD